MARVRIPQVSFPLDEYTFLSDLGSNPAVVIAAENAPPNLLRRFHPPEVPVETIQHSAVQ